MLPEGVGSVSLVGLSENTGSEDNSTGSEDNSNFLDLLNNNPLMILQYLEESGRRTAPDLTIGGPQI